MLCLTLALCVSTAPLKAYTHSDQNIKQTQYANIAPLPGACVAISARGEPDGLGACQINIPVAYTPGKGFVALGAFAGAHLRGPVDEFGNGSGYAAAGFFEKRRLFVSAMKVSHIWDESRVFSFQALVRDGSDSIPSVSIGIQDIFEKEPDGRSPYLVATKTYSVGKRTAYATIGFGGGRFLDNPFGGLSIPINDRLNTAVEHDGYQLNVGLAYRPGGREGKICVLSAYNGKCGWLLGISAAAMLTHK